jgi:predicted aspartyl protease
MIQGVVNFRYELMLPLVVGDSTGQREFINTGIDTGFDGFLSLPSEIIVRLGLPWRTSNIATLGDGSKTLFDFYAGTVIWDGQYRMIDIAFIVLLAGTGVTGDRVLLEQQTAILRASGASTNEIESNRKVMETILPIVKASEESREILLDRLVEAVKEIQPRVPERRIRRDMSLLTSSWVRFFLNYDPAPTLATVECPVLALNGSKDVQVIPQQNLTAIEQTLERSGNPNFRTLELAGLNHLFQTAQTGAPDEYEEIEETFSPAALELIADWIEQDAIGS